MGIFDFFRKKEQPVASNELEILLEKAFLDDAFQEDFHACLLSSPVLVLVAASYNEEDEALPILKYRDTHIPIFSSVERIMENRRLWKSGVKYVPVNAETFLRSLEDTPVMLNPFSGCSKEFTVADLEDLLGAPRASHPEGAGHPDGTESPASANVRVGVPAGYPDELANALTEMFSGEPGIRKAYILLSLTGDTPRNFLIAAEYDGDLQGFVDRNDAPLQAVLPEGVRVEFATLASLEAFSEAIDEAEPFYVGAAL